MSKDKTKKHHSGEEIIQPANSGSLDGADIIEPEVLEHADIENSVDAEDGAEETVDDVITGLRAEVALNADKFLRLMAEFDNLKRRHERDAEKIREHAAEKIINDLIDVRENFQRALATPGTDVDKVVEGLQLISSKFDGCLANHGLSYFGEVGDDFNPEIHEAMMRQPHDKIKEDRIVSVFEKGYKLKSKVIRHAKVIVSSGKE